MQAAGGSPAGGGAGAAAAALSGGTAAARTELHRLQREVQWEVAQLNAETNAAGARVALDEFMQSLFAASVGAGGEEAAAPAPPPARPTLAGVVSEVRHPAKAELK